MNSHNVLESSVAVDMTQGLTKYTGLWQEIKSNKVLDSTLASDHQLKSHKVLGSRLASDISNINYKVTLSG